MAVEIDPTCIKLDRGCLSPVLPADKARRVALADPVDMCKGDGWAWVCG